MTTTALTNHYGPICRPFNPKSDPVYFPLENGNGNFNFVRFFSDINARISVLFDPDISPRNFAIICEKTYKVKEHGKFNEQRQ